MPKTLPPEFDPEWYSASYSDVSLSGLDPREHYRRFGRVLGRPPCGPPETKRQASPSSSKADKKLQPSSSAPVEAAPVGALPSPKLKKSAPPIIDRPQGLERSTVIAAVAAPKKASSNDGTFDLDDLAAAGGEPTQQVRDSYRRLLNLPGDRVGRTDQPTTCGSWAFRTGGTRIENASMVDGARLRLMLAGAERGNGVSLRAYQAQPSSPANLLMMGQGVQLPSEGPVLHDFELVHPLMPVLLELEGVEGFNSALALLPFPSLLPGGLHNAELKALQVEPSPMDDFWERSEVLLRETVGGKGWPERWVSCIATVGQEQGSKEEPGLAEVREWLLAVFGLDWHQSDDGASGGRGLILPRNSIPTIGALASRHLSENENAYLQGPYLVAEPADNRPKWSITLVADQAGDAAAPRVSGVLPETALRPARTPLAITLRPVPNSSHAAPPEQAAVVVEDALAILVDATTAAATARLLAAIKDVVPNVTEILIRAPDGLEGLQPALAAAPQGVQPRSVSYNASLREIAKDIRADTLLTLSDRVVLRDGAALCAVLEMLKRRDTAASASCALLAEKIVKKDVVLQPASGGLFPTGVSLVRGPSLTFGEPDVLQALPDLEYQVAANTLLFTAWRRAALADLQNVPGTRSSISEDVRLGLELLRSGYTNWCTTRVTARLSGPYAPRDEIDPVGPGFMAVPRWEDVLGKVTLVRELF
ncbi:hypothetical protein G7077_03220 [Sphingomonas piscis]|uniref:Uncharacterized protein n=1 Tax=Sphingomonas piscis TaxID=2714943 RepID=A0A6G7YMV2_9SPHN|nr:hypothetical protein [Sphingomonas piscis]QIK78068.1 hypothetical protein G7077_03220 [Sphingomonas piscis]